MLRQLILMLGLVLGGCAGVPTIDDSSPDPSPDPSLDPSLDEDPDVPGVLVTADGARRVAPNALDYTGQGRYTWPDGDRYEGEWQDGLPHGGGHYTARDGSTYTGEFVEGRRQGYGEERGADEIYRGQWLEGVREGYGELLRRDGTAYAGDWVANEWHGFGRVDEPNGYSYDGQWQHGRREGYGRLAAAGTLEYEGTWLANRRAGWGLEAGLDGSTYEGRWANDLKSGRGELHRTDGTFHHGLWENNQPLGPGTRRSTDGVEITGLWNGDQITSGLVRLPSGAEFAGRLFDRRENRPDARLVAWLEPLAHTGDPHASLLLATLFSAPAAETDAQRMQHWLETAAAANLPEAWYRLATATPAVIPDLELLGRAAAAGHGPANHELAAFYLERGDGPADLTRARRHLEQAVVRGEPEARRELAWLLATAPEADLRDGARAVALILPVVVRGGEWRDLDALAAALAESGDFEAAATRAREALAGAPDDAGERAPLEARLALYEAGRPYHQPPADSGAAP